MLNYLSKYIPGIASLLKPGTDLLKNDTVWRWGQEQEKAFVQVDLSVEQSIRGNLNEYKELLRMQDGTILPDPFTLKEMDWLGESACVKWPSLVLDHGLELIHRHEHTNPRQLGPSENSAQTAQPADEIAQPNDK
ncbi:hypothetical protein LSH36_1826g00005 [Paralvinella palmiformis]|uniref:Uncharacterized protein n=1 Tax=Paralvinella palmiformis TaxID=53620 RepID=A0AAD9IRM0_9ANNE|nr:hypothetical protein LSH36_1826g00005 [Paralvinella palmiformis]